MGLASHGGGEVESIDRIVNYGLNTELRQLMPDWNRIKSELLDITIYKITASIVFSIYLLLVLSTTTMIVHNSPLNRVVNSSDSHPFHNAIPKLQDAGSYPGLTFGEVQTPIHEQVRAVPALVIFTNEFILFTLSFSVLLIIAFRIFKFFQPQLTERKRVLLFFVMIFGFLGMVLLFLDFVPQVAYITKDWRRKSVLWAAMNWKIHPLFVILLMIQSIIISTLLFIWTRTIVPVEFKSNRTELQKKIVHIENWKQYGTWIVTIFGSIALTAILVFVQNVSSFGGLLIRHIVILLGGVVVLGLMFVILKIHRLESELMNGNETENRPRIR